MAKRKQSASHVVGNAGLYYVSFRLSQRGWNVMPTSRNARGVDIVILSQDARTTHTVQVKALSKRSPVPLGENLDSLIADFFVVCRKVGTDLPECFVLRSSEIEGLAHRGEKEGRVSYWLQPKAYETKAFHDKWDRIGTGE